jgi:hypothetical protein
VVVKIFQFKFTRLLSGWMLAVILLVCGSSGMVLCTADGGHFAVESAHQGKCSSTTGEAGQAHGEASGSTANIFANTTGGCMDVSFGLDTVSNVPKDMRPDLLQKFTGLKEVAPDYVALTSAEDHAIQILADGEIPRLSHSLIALRTVVLRV